MIEFTELCAIYSDRRPAPQAWRVESGGQITYAESELRALELHRSKLEVSEQIHELIGKCAALSVN